ncbi:MAG: ABC transporter ATP-binding protein, partial [candidate division Zixibacteria bacterium]|nr:ABC transporter ATP-binding protein [candidate division Zixibacteria bacterium]
YGRIKVLNGISFEVKKGDIVSILGANGAGKTTVLRTISGINFCDYGEIAFEGQRIENLDPNKIVKLGISHLPEGRRVFPELTITENLKMGAYICTDKGQIKNSFEWVYSIFPILKTRGDQKAKHMSGGEQQMLAFGRALMIRPKLLLLDEPSLGLSPFLVKEIFKTVTYINSEGVTVLMVEQNANQALKISNYGYVLMMGNIDIHGTPEKLLHDEDIRESYLGEGKYIDRKRLWEGRPTIRR